MGKSWGVGRSLKPRPLPAQESLEGYALTQTFLRLRPSVIGSEEGSCPSGINQDTSGPLEKNTKLGGALPPSLDHPTTTEAVGREAVNSRN